MGNELLKIADGFSMVAEGFRGLAGVEKNDTADTAEKNVIVDADKAGTADAGDVQKPGKEVKKAGSKKEKAVAIEDVRAVMAQKTQDGKSKEIRELLQKYGAVKLSAVAPEHYPELLKEAGAL